MGAVELVEQVGGGGGRCDVRPHRHGVDQQAHHGFCPGHLGGPVTISSDVAVLAAQRVQYYQTFNEVASA